MHVKQGIAAELLSGESQMRESFFGRTVWRNWGMDKFKTNKKAWFAMAGSAAGPLDSADASHEKEKEKGKDKQKTPIEVWCSLVFLFYPGTRLTRKARAGTACRSRGGEKDADGERREQRRRHRPWK